MTNKKQPLVLWFKQIRLSDVGLVGGKNASLGEMFSNLSKLGIKVPNGFAITAAAYRHFLQVTGLKKQIADTLKNLNTSNLRDLQARGKAVRQMILNAAIPTDLTDQIRVSYKELGKLYSANPDVAVRSSATAEDLPGASFAGQQETYLNVVGINEVLKAVKKGFASLFTDRAISYRHDKGFSHFDVALSIGVQKMVRSDVGSSGVAFTIDTETGFDNVVVINSIFGLGEFIVQGTVTPDELVIFKPTLSKSYNSLISRKLGRKNIKLVYGRSGTVKANVSPADQAKFALSDKEALKLAKWCVSIENYFSKKYKHYQAMDIEWAKDGKSKELYIVQARPETVHSMANKNIHSEYQLKGKGKVLVSGIAVGSKIASGKVRVISSPKKINDFKPGEVLVTQITDPDWEPVMKIASAIITDKGGRTSHAAIVSRELGIACVVGTENATKKLKTVQMVTVDCSSGNKGEILSGKVPFKLLEHRIDKLPVTRTKLMVNIGEPAEAFKFHSMPASGVGLGRLEFIIMEDVKIHPNALLDYHKLKSSNDSEKKKIVVQIDDLTSGYSDKVQYYVDTVAAGVAKIGAAFYPREVIIRFSDFKTNEYRSLVGGQLYEPIEENPMLGWRGASRYYDPKFAEAFKLECRALNKVRQEFGLVNVVPMVPFCRTVEEGAKTLKIMKDTGVHKKGRVPVMSCVKFLRTFSWLMNFWIFLTACPSGRTTSCS